jgi:uncharacterized protein
MDSTNNMEVKKIMVFGRVVLILLAVFLAVASLNAFKNWRNISPVFNSISVSGEGEFVSVPDIATFSYTVSAEGKDVAAAQALVTKSGDAVLAALKDLGIEERDIRTTDYSVYPKYVYTQTVCSQNYCPPSRQIPDGYTVSQTVSIKVRDTAKAGEALSVAGEKGATNISGLNFTTDDPNKNVNEARAKAIEDARSKAESLADSLGVRLVRVVSFSDNYNPMPYYGREVGMGGAMDTKNQAAPTIPVGENETRVSVTVTYEIR